MSASPAAMEDAQSDGMCCTPLLAWISLQTSSYFCWDQLQWQFARSCNSIPNGDDWPSKHNVISTCPICSRSSITNGEGWRPRTQAKRLVKTRIYHEIGTTICDDPRGTSALGPFGNLGNQRLFILPVQQYHKQAMSTIKNQCKLNGCSLRMQQYHKRWGSALQNSSRLLTVNLAPVS